METKTLLPTIEGALGTVMLQATSGFNPDNMTQLLQICIVVITGIVQFVTLFKKSKSDVK